MGVKHEERQTFYQLLSSIILLQRKSC